MRLKPSFAAHGRVFQFVRWFESLRPIQFHPPRPDVESTGISRRLDAMETAIPKSTAGLIDAYAAGDIHKHILLAKIHSDPLFQYGEQIMPGVDSQNRACALRHS